MRIPRSALLASAFLYPAFLGSGVALAQSGFISPDGKDRYPGVTIFCPSGTGVAPCSFTGGGGGGGSGTVAISLGGTAVGSSNRFPVSDSLLDGLISGGALAVGGSVAVSNFPATQTVAGTVSISGTPSVALTGSPSVSLAGALPAGSNTLGSVTLTPGSSGSVTAGGTGGSLAQAVQGIGGGVPLTVAGAVSQAGTWSVGVTALPALGAGTNAIGSVSVSNLPATQPVSGSVSVSALPALPAGSNPIGSVSVSNFPATQPVSGAVSVSALPALPAGTNAIGSVSVSNFPATQAVTAASLPLPAGAALDSDLVAPYASIAPAAATATKSLVVGCLSNTTLPSFTAGQQGAVPCDSSGRLYVTTVPSANNVPSYLQAVSAGGATPFSAINAASSCMATNLKTSSGMVFSYSVSNSNSSGVWFRLFASGTAPTCGSGTPSKRIYVPAGATVSLSTDLGWVFSGGIGFDVTAGSGADSDATTVTSANSVLVDVDYK